MYSSMFLDEDEDLAHEFYEEYRILDHAESVVRWTMRRIKDNLRPQVNMRNLYNSFYRNSGIFRSSKYFIQADLYEIKKKII